jgi:hypothetical protein
MLKRRPRKSFGEQISQLIGRLNLHHLDMVGVHVLAKPMVFDGVVFGTGSHASWLELGQGKSTNVVLMDSNVHVGYRIDWNSNRTS